MNKKLDKESLHVLKLGKDKQKETLQISTKLKKL